MRKYPPMGGKLVVSLAVRAVPEQGDLRVAHAGGWRAGRGEDVAVVLFSQNHARSASCGADGRGD